MKDLCIERGCHYSANLHADFLREELSEFIESKYWVVLPYALIRHYEDLMFSPAAVKEERERKPRLLCDHSWNWTGWPSVNETTIPHAPPESMQFGRALPRILRHTRHANPKFGPPKACKYDIKDGFYKLLLKARDCLRLALVFPKFEGEDQLVAIPLACTMGWVQSPPTFCTMSETICDLANKSIRERAPRKGTHRLEEAASCQDDLDLSMEPRPKDPEDRQADEILQALPGVETLEEEPEHQAPPSNRAYSKPLASTDVFMDDFIQLGQGGKNRMITLRGYLLDAVDQVLSKPLPESQRVEAVSLKKLLKGDGSWATRKVILGWILDTVRQTIELTPHRKLVLARLFEDLASTRRVSHKKWERYLGQLRFVSVAIPGSAGLFSALQLALTASKGNRIRITKALRSHINAFASLAASLSHRPTHLAEIVPQEPSALGATDAAKPGMGGIFYDHTGQPYVWRQPFPPDIQADLVSKDHLSGRITNSDLEQAALLAQVDVMCESTGFRYATYCNGTDNTPAASRITKGAVTSDGPAAHLCNYACMHQRHHRYCHEAFFLPGTSNVMADDASRLQALTDAAFLSHFEQHYPQDRPWRLLHLSPETCSRLMQALRSKSPAEPSLQRLDNGRALLSDTGNSSAKPTTSPLPSVTSRIPWTNSPTSSSTSGDTDKSAAVRNLSDLIRSRPSSRPLARGYPTWASQIHGSHRVQSSSIPYSLISSQPSPKKTTHRPDPTLSTAPSCDSSPSLHLPPTPGSTTRTATCNTSSSWPSIGSSGRQNTSTPPTLAHIVKPSPFVASSSPSTTVCGTPRIPRVL